MNRPLRIRLDRALFHITVRGNRKGRIYLSDSDRMTWLALLGETCARFNFSVLAYCQMTNHFHILLETFDGQLSRGMRHLNGSYSQYFNRQHRLVGHLFQGRFTAILCQSDLYLKELARYIELNPVRARMVALPSHWLWSSHGAAMGMVDGQEWLKSDQLLACFDSDQHQARQAYGEFVIAGIDMPSPLRAMTHQLILGDEAFCARVVGSQCDGNLAEVKRSQRRAISRPLQDYFAEFHDPKVAMAHAYRSLAYSMPEIAQFARVSVKTVSRAVKAFEEK
ncbi:transposase [Pseudoduganella violaceinigra]|uniref:transposase n=1 Tax=Pseudoduganella violaceinigra TaxID=246602 RepID=UPI0004895652|nr:transposase [Pseudoduganella violaceinigra]